MLALANSLPERGYKVDLAVVRAEGPFKTSVHPRVRVVEFKARGVLASLPSLTQYMRRERPDTLFSAMNHANIVALWARRLAGVATRVIVSEHNTLSTWACGTSSIRNRTMPWLIRFFYPWADGIVAVSRDVAGDLAETTKLPRTRIQVIYNPVVTPQLLEMARVKPPHTWFAVNQPPVVLAVGRLTPQKDFATLIRAFDRVRRDKHVRLMILGEGGDRHELERLVRQLRLEPHVSLPGFVENPYSYMAHAAVFVLSSRWEGLPTVLIEALSCGMRVIATDCPSGPREILADGKYGMLVPMHDAPALAEAIAATLNEGTPKPSADSWQPYKLNSVIDQYAHLLFNGNETASSTGN